MKWNQLILWLVIALAFVFQMLVIVPSGSRYCPDRQCGVYFWGAHEHDSVWHLAVSETLFNNIPFQMPNMSDTLIKGYNYLLDLTVATLSLVTTIPDNIWFFKLLPIVWFGVMITLCFRLANVMRKSATLPIYLIFFVFFGSSFSYLINLFQRSSLWGASSLLSMQALQNMLNPQFAYSLIPLLFMIIMIGEKKRSYNDYLVFGILTAIAIGLKFYTGLVMAIMIGSDLIITIVKDKGERWSSMIKGLIILVLTALSVFIFYSPGNSGGSPLIFSPLTTVNPIIEDRSLVYLPKWAERLYSYQGIKLFIVEFFVLILFIAMNYGTRILSMFGALVKDDRSNVGLIKFIWIGAIASLLLSILFIQRGVWWNTVQFLYVSLFLSGIIAANTLDLLHRMNSFYSKIVIALIIILTIPTNLDVIKTFTTYPGSSYIKDEELQGLQFLRDQDKGVVFTGNFLSRPALRYDTAYIAAYSQKNTYLSDEIQLELTNIDYQKRQEMALSFDCEVLEQVDYLYELSNNLYISEFGECGRKNEKIFENSTVKIYKVL